MTNIKKYVLMGVVVGLTLISLFAGFHFYRSLFDIKVAVLCCVLFEIIRLGCLWSFVILNWLNKLITIPLYIFVSLICALAAITSFHSSIIERQKQDQKPLEEELSRRINIIKHEYAKRISNELIILNEKIDICQRKLALNPDAVYWKNRLSQRTTERQQLQEERDRFLSEQITDQKEEWISRNASILSIEFEPLSSSIGGSTHTTKAIEQLWGISEIRTKKIVSIIIVLTVEFGILLLSLLAKENVPKIKAIIENSNIQILKEKFEDHEINRFLSRCQDFLTQYNRLPFSRELGKKQREMLKLVSQSDGYRLDLIQGQDEIGEKTK